MKSLFKKTIEKIKFNLLHIETKYIFVAFHFYFLLDLFKLRRFRVLQFLFLDQRFCA